jgi:hypothetical protein
MQQVLFFAAKFGSMLAPSRLAAVRNGSHCRVMTCIHHSFGGSAIRVGFRCGEKCGLSLGYSASQGVLVGVALKTLGEIEAAWSFKHVLRFVSKRAAFPPLGLLTIAASPPVEWQVKLVDLNVSSLADDDLRWADHVMISAMIVHKTSVSEIVDRCHRLGKPVIAGGPLFTTGHAAFPDLDHFVLGEAEELMPQLIEDMRCGTLRHTCSAPSRPDITRVPSPRWDLINLRDYVTMSVQFSRGCTVD